MHAFTLNLLASAMVSIAGLSLIRGFAAPLLLPPAERVEGTTLLFVAGAVGGIVLAPLVFGALCLLNPAEWRVPAAPRSDPLRPGTVAVIITGLLTFIFAGLAFAMARWPIEVAPLFAANGVLSVGVGVLCVLFAAAAAASQRSTPLMHYRDEQGSPKDYLLKPVALPTTVLLLLVAIVVGRYDLGSTYHDVRFDGAAGSTSTVTLADAFASWSATAEQCRPASTETQFVPMLFAAAAGGGIRAAYWTEGVLDELTDGSSPRPGQSAADARNCARDSMFLVSSASGGSLGATLWSSDSTDHAAGPAHGASIIADGSSLAAIAAAFLFRDTAHSWAGWVDPDWDDRAAIIEQSWAQRLDGSEFQLGAPFLEGAGPAGASAPWRPLLMLNSTDLLTQCQVVLTRLDSRSKNPLADCDDPTQSGQSLPGSYFVSDFGDTSACRPHDHPMSLRTAALLSGRFPFVTPTGTLYGCHGGSQYRRLQLADGGYLENSGILTAIHVWRALEPLVAAHNRAVLGGQTAGT